MSAFPSAFIFSWTRSVLSLSVVVSLQVHKLEPEVWKSVEAIYIDIADRSQVLPKVW